MREHSTSAIGRVCLAGVLAAGLWLWGSERPRALIEKLASGTAGTDPITIAGPGRAIDGDTLVVGGVRVCRAAGRELNAEMVRNGLAWAYVRYSQRYAALEADARSRLVGVWAGRTEPPWSYRAQRWPEFSISRASEYDRPRVPADALLPDGSEARWGWPSRRRARTGNDSQTGTRALRRSH